ncbi:MAG TPA: hypothetical protein VLG10_04785 [Methylomirabilota bacterium]|nr:hypothetical protein [Methylomirabilota bacterium]
MNTTGALVLTLLGLLMLAACATSNPSPPPPSGQRVRCLSDPREKDMRPLFHFFCVESP